MCSFSSMVALSSLDMMIVDSIHQKGDVYFIHFASIRRNVYLDDMVCKCGWWVPQGVETIAWVGQTNNSWYNGIMGIDPTPCTVVSDVICASSVPRVASHYFGIAGVGDGGHLGSLRFQILPKLRNSGNQKIPYILSPIRNTGAEKCGRTSMHYRWTSMHYR